MFQVKEWAWAWAWGLQGAGTPGFLLGWGCCSGNFNWGMDFITPQDPLPQTPARPKKSLSPDFLHS